VDGKIPENVCAQLRPLFQSSFTQMFSAQVMTALKRRFDLHLRVDLDASITKWVANSLFRKAFVSGAWNLGDLVYKVQCVVIACVCSHIPVVDSRSLCSGGHSRQLSLEARARAGLRLTVRAIVLSQPMRHDTGVPSAGR
jgi:hypothetical protein